MQPEWDAEVAEDGSMLEGKAAERAAEAPRAERDAAQAEDQQEMDDFLAMKESKRK